MRSKALLAFDDNPGHHWSQWLPLLAVQVVLLNSSRTYTDILGHQVGVLEAWQIPKQFYV